jgi:hypothetical protein
MVNGCGTWIHPIPSEGEVEVALSWFCLLYIPIIPLGYSIIKGQGGDSYSIIKKLKWSEMKILPKGTKRKIVLGSYLYSIIKLIVLALIIVIGLGVFTFFPKVLIFLASSITPLGLGYGLFCLLRKKISSTTFAILLVVVPVIILWYYLYLTCLSIFFRNI